MTDKETMKLALEALKLVNIEFVCNGAHHAKKDRHSLGEDCPVTMRYQTAITALEERLAQPAPVQEPVKLRRGDVLRCIETDELCTVWATSTTHKTSVRWGGNDFSDYTAEQIGELFWLEPESEDVEIAAEQSDNYAAFHAGVRFARAHPPAAPVQEPGHCDPSTTVYKLAEMVMSDCGHSSNNQRLLDRIADRIQRHMDDVTPPAAPVQEPTAVDLSHVDRLTHTKTKGITEQRKYNITGFVLTNDDGKKCISDMTAVRWFEGGDFFAMMHTDSAQPAQRKPLTDDQIYEMYNEPRSDAEMLEFARAIKAAHGIKE